MRPQRTIRDMTAPPGSGKYSRVGGRFQGLRRLTLWIAVRMQQSSIQPVGDRATSFFAGWNPSGLCTRLVNLRVARFEDFVDEIDALLIGKESALHGIDGDLLEIGDRQAERVRRRFEFPSHRRIAHQPVVGVERYPKFLLVK